MYEELFKCQTTLAKHRDAPLFEERKHYLEYRAKEGCAQSTLLRFARQLFWIVKAFPNHFSPNQHITPEEIEVEALEWAKKQCQCGRAKDYKWPRQHFTEKATLWFRFLGCLEEPVSPTMPFEVLIKDFADYMEHERGLSCVTIKQRCWHVRQFLYWYYSQKDSLYTVEVTDVDAFFMHNKHYSRVSIVRCSPKSTPILKKNKAQDYSISTSPFFFIFFRALQ